MLLFGCAASLSYVACDSNANAEYDTAEASTSTMVIEKETPDRDGVKTENEIKEKNLKPVGETTSTKEVYTLSEVDVAPFFGQMCDKTAELAKCNQKNIVSFVKDNITLPEEAESNPFYGLEHVKVTINADGTMADVKYVSTKKEDCSWCQKTAVDVVGKMTTWKPAMKNGQPVPVEITIPIKFLS